MICCQFIFKPGTYDDDFHSLDGQIDSYARSLPGFLTVDTWVSKDGTVTNASYFFKDMAAVRQLSSFAQHQQAKSEYARWYDGYQIVVCEVKGAYGDGRLSHITQDLEANDTDR